MKCNYTHEWSKRKSMEEGLIDALLEVLGWRPTKIPPLPAINAPLSEYEDFLRQVYADAYRGRVGVQR